MILDITNVFPLSVETILSSISTGCRGTLQEEGGFSSWFLGIFLIFFLCIEEIPSDTCLPLSFKSTPTRHCPSEFQQHACVFPFNSTSILWAVFQNLSSFQVSLSALPTQHSSLWFPACQSQLTAIHQTLSSSDIICHTLSHKLQSSVLEKISSSKFVPSLSTLPQP